MNFNLSDYWWVFSGIASSCVYFAIALVFFNLYSEKSFLFRSGSLASIRQNWTEYLARYADLLTLPKFRKQIELKLSRANYKHARSTSQFIAGQILDGIIGAFFSYILLVTVLGQSFFLVVISFAFAASLSYIKLSELASIRYNDCEKNLPYYIDYISLAMGAGLEFNSALLTVVEDAPEGPLRDEFSQVLSSIRLGSSRADALNAMASRLNSPGMNLFVQTLLQSMKMGSDVVHTLGVISETLQGKRFQNAEEAAGQISVKMMIPIMVFVMPASLIILLGPMMIQWFSSTSM